MGEDFLRRRNDRFRRQRDDCFREHLGRDLFTDCPPETTTSVCGSVVNESVVSPKGELWAPCPAADGKGPVRFFCGGVVALEVAGDQADYLRREYGGSGTPLLGQVVQIVAEHRLAELRVGRAEATR
ncbi:hypothetical protein [Polyangium sp. 15x6]|uniref:hypothetical protein n=1 Tax=Polyangium sp. 15x6 TaxID=3042687 RepID=UPI00249C8644|nr:hypothetical protein [Polyangium sp. 15x6]MDI3290719.1 hypothetical protein [Polyangium sp. 15x6]